MTFGWDELRARSLRSLQSDWSEDPDPEVASALAGLAGREE